MSPYFHTYDAAGNMTDDNYHTYTYDAEGNITAVDGGSTASYLYNALNQRVQTTVAGAPRNFVYNAAGQRVTIWNANTGAQTQGQYYWGGKRVAFYSGGSLHFQHQDWLGTERVRTTYNGGVEGTFASLPFGDGLTTDSGGSDLDAYHFATVDHDYEDETDHAQFRQYSEAQGHWLSPDPYGGSYDFSNPQSFNRYAYVLNNPLSNVDPSGLVLCDYGTNADGSEEYGDEDTDADCIASQGTVVNVGATVTVGASGNSSISVGGIVFIFGPANAPNSGPPQPQHFWQKPGCGSSIGQTALGLAGSAVEVGAVIFVGPELLAAAGAEAGGAALLEGGELVESGMSVAHVATGLGTLLAAPAVLTANGTMGIFKNCF